MDTGQGEILSRSYRAESWGQAHLAEDQPRCSRKDHVARGGGAGGCVEGGGVR